MKLFLYLYPNWEYILISLGYCAHDSTISGKQLELLGELIDTRYRQNGYKVAWLINADQEDHSNIDLSSVDSRICFDPSDLLINAGVSCYELWSERIYADSAYIFSQIEPKPEILRLGGFHCQDCVAKLAEYAYGTLGMKENVLIDEPLTEWFFIKSRLKIDSEYRNGQTLSYDPLPFDYEMSYEGFGFTHEEGWPDHHLWKKMRNLRKTLPYMIQN